jgi:hypothetical protein
MIERNIQSVNSYVLPGIRFETRFLFLGSVHIGVSEDESLTKEELALYALRRWHKVCHGSHRLVPEHIETRSLFHPKKPGIEQVSKLS